MEKPVLDMTKNVFKKWLDTLGQAWMTKNPDMAADICMETVMYYEDPFEAPLKGKKSVRNVWEEALKNQKDIQFAYDIVAAVGAQGIARWQATYTRVVDEKTLSLDGIFIVTLNSEGLCKEFHMWWNSKSS